MADESSIDLDPSTVGQGDWTVEPGDSMVSIADQTGHFWQTIWNDPANADLQEARENPETLLPGDKVTVPDLRQKTEQRETDLIHVFKRKGVPVSIEYRVTFPNGDPMPEKRYILKVGKRRYEGATDEDGKLQHWISPSAKVGKLTILLEEKGLPEMIQENLAVGSLPPIETVVGIQSRLVNIGYAAVLVTGTLDDATRNAITAFQSSRTIDPTGEPDQETLDALLEAHGS